MNACRLISRWIARKRLGFVRLIYILYWLTSCTPIDVLQLQMSPQQIENRPVSLAFVLKTPNDDSFDQTKELPTGLIRTFANCELFGTTISLLTKRIFKQPFPTTKTSTLAINNLLHRSLKSPLRFISSRSLVVTVNG